MSQVYDYYPYGSEALNTQLSTTDAAHSFTDKELDEDLGLYYFEARWYSSDIGRFSSLDPAQLDNRVFKLLNDPQALNFYAYSRNNPIVYIDPTGETFNSKTGWNAFTMLIDSTIETVSWGTKSFVAGATAPTNVFGATLSADLFVGAVADLDDAMVSATNALGNTINAFQGEETQVFATEGAYDQMLSSVPEVQNIVDGLQTISDVVQFGVDTKSTVKTIQSISNAGGKAGDIIADTMSQIFSWTYNAFDTTLDVFTGENSSQILNNDE